MKVNLVLPLLFLGVASHTVRLMAQSSGAFTATGGMTTSRYRHTATLLANGKVLIAGGVMMIESPSIFSKVQSSAELYDPGTGTFKATGSMTTARASHTATLLADGRVLIAGSDISPTGPTFSSAELYDPDTGRFTATGDMTVVRGSHTATLLSDGRVLIAGGLQGPTSPDSVYHFPANAELYDPSTGVFTATGAIMTEEFAETATLLVNGKVLMTTAYGASELYDPSTGTFSGTGTHAFHLGPTATLLTNGKVLVAGGSWCDGCGPSPLAELYDPDSGTFARTGNLMVERQGHSAALLPDGTVLFAGFFAASAEIYDPIKGTYTTIGGLLAERIYHTATLLNDGRILIAGGLPPYNLARITLSSAELYTPQVLVPTPVLLSLSGDGKGQGSILHANTPQLASSDNPVAVGEALEIYLTGLIDGSVIPPQVAIGGRMAEMLWFGNTPSYAGLNQINVRVPAGVVPGPAVPVRLTYIGRPSNEVTIGVR